MNLYVAGKYDSVALDTVIEWLTAKGHALTYDWRGAAILKPYQSNRIMDFPIAERMRDGVLEADALVLVVVDGMMGGWVEFGIALASLKPIICVGAWPNGHPERRPGLEATRRDSIFELFPCVRHAYGKLDLFEVLSTIQHKETHEPTKA